MFRTSSEVVAKGKLEREREEEEEESTNETRNQAGESTIYMTEILLRYSRLIDNIE
jgi:hypothetical protein